MTCMDICGHIILHTDIICWLFISNYFFREKNVPSKESDTNEKKLTDQLMILLKRGRIFTVDASTSRGCWWGQLGFWTHGSQLGNQTKHRQLPVSWEDRFPLKNRCQSWFFLVEISDKLLGKHVEVLILSISAIFIYSDENLSGILLVCYGPLRKSPCGSSFEFDNHGCYYRFPSFYFFNWRKSVLVDWHGS